jgi:hypothetical protein
MITDALGCALWTRMSPARAVSEKLSALRRREGVFGGLREGVCRTKASVIG